MSDRRVKYIILASVIFVGIVGISQGQGLFELNDVNTTTPTASLGYIGHVSVFLKDSDGNIKAYRQGDNTVVNAGRDCASSLLFDTGLGVDCMMVRFMAIGSSDTSVFLTQTALLDQTENGKVFLSLTGDTVNPTDPAFGGTLAVINFEKKFIILEADSGEQIAETGLFDNSATTTGNMFARHVFPGIMVTTDDELTIGWRIETVGTVE